MVKVATKLVAGLREVQRSSEDDVWYDALSESDDETEELPTATEQLSTATNVITPESSHKVLKMEEEEERQRRRRNIRDAGLMMQ